MPMPAYLTIEGETQGLISQGATTFDSITNEWQAGHEDEIMVQAFDHAVITPRDPQSGNPKTPANPSPTLAAPPNAAPIPAKSPPDPQRQRCNHEYC